MTLARLSSVPASKWGRRLRLPIRGVEFVMNWLAAGPFILMPLMVLFLIAAGRLGQDMGLDDLFWHDDRRCAFLNGISLGLLLWQVLLIHFLLLHRRNRFKLFLRDKTGTTKRPAVQIYFMALYLTFGLAILVSRVPIELPGFLGTWLTPLDHRSDSWLCLGLGLMLSFLVGLLLLSRAHQLRFGTKMLKRLKAVEAQLTDDRHRWGDPIRPGDEFLHNLACTWFMFALAAFLIIYALHAWPIYGLPPITVLGVLLSLGVAVYGFMAFHLRGLQYVTMGVLTLLVLSSSSSYQLELPGLSEEYAKMRQAALAGYSDEALAGTTRVDTVLERLRETGVPEGQVPKVRRRNFYLERPAAPGILQTTELLKAMGRENPKRKLIVVCASGGGIRAAVWTALMLERMERELPNFHRDVRLLTGASGGMLALASYAAEFEQFDFGTAPAGSGMVDAGPLAAVMEMDSLSFPVQTMLLHDLPRWFWPGPTRRDRGHAIEEQWVRNWQRVRRQPNASACPLNRTMADLRPTEGQLARPSVILSPMIVEDGRRLLISNLDLEPLTTASGTLAHLPEQHSIFSRGALEYTRLFPNHSLPVRTAARLSASFPLVSPTVELPTYPPLRVVDAGYFDNFGVNLAAYWLYHHRELIKENTSGVLFVQIRAYADDFERYNIRSWKTDSVMGNSATPHRKGQAFSEHVEQPDLASGEDRDFVQLSPLPRKSLKDVLAALVTPLEGVLNSMQAQQRYGNDLALQLLSGQFNSSKPDEMPFFQTLILEYRGEASLSWQLSRAECDDLVRKARHPALNHRFAVVGDWLGPRAAPTLATRPR